MASKKKVEHGPLSVRAEGTDDGTVKFSVGGVVPTEEFEEGQDEHEWVEDSSFELDTDAAVALGDAIDNAVQDARSRVLRNDRDGLAAHTADGTAVS
jgi:hypothetical protein